MSTFNKVVLLGNLTRDPELRYTPQGAAVCEFTLALNYSYTNKQSGQKVEEVSFIDIVAWARTAEICAEYLKKGRQVLVEGRLKQDRWESPAPESKKMSKVRVTAENIQFVGSRPAGEGGGKTAAAPTEAPAGEPPPPGTEEDIPF